MSADLRQEQLMISVQQYLDNQERVRGERLKMGLTTSVEIRTILFPHAGGRRCRRGGHPL